MGTDKAALTTATGESFLERTVRCMVDCCDRVQVLGEPTGGNAGPAIPVRPDRRPYSGPLDALANLDCDEGFAVLAVDTPDVSPALVLEMRDALLAVSGSVLGAIPVVDDWLQPLVAVYNPAVLPVWQNARVQGETSIVRTLSAVQDQLLLLRPGDLSLPETVWNTVLSGLNTRSDYDQWLAMNQ